MAKTSGLSLMFLASGVDLSGDTQSIDTISCPRGTFDMNGLNVAAMERIYGRRDGVMSLTSYFNPAASKAHAKWKALPTTDQDLMVGLGSTIGVGGAAMRGKQINYDGARAADGQFLLKIDAQSNCSATTSGFGHGLEYGRMMTARTRTDTGATNGASVDFGTGSLAFGLRAWLQVISFAGTDATIKLQESSDDGGADAFANVTGGAFTAVTAGPTTERIETSGSQTVERYLRVATTTVGGFTSLVFAVMVHRNEATPV